MSESVETFTITGNDYDKVANQFYKEPNRKRKFPFKSRSINNLRNWFQQLKFKNSTRKLILLKIFVYHQADQRV